jgi:hypothetical protein
MLEEPWKFPLGFGGDVTDTHVSLLPLYAYRVQACGAEVEVCLF